MLLPLTHSPPTLPPTKPRDLGSIQAKLKTPKTLEREKGKWGAYKTETTGISLEVCIFTYAEYSTRILILLT